MNEEETQDDEEVETIYIGSKPLMRYVMAGMSIFLDESPQAIHIAARGRAISRAVDTAEVLRTRYLKGILDLDEVVIGTDELEDEKTGNIDRVSSITIKLEKVSNLPQETEEEISEELS